MPHGPGEWPWATFAVNVAGVVVLAWLTTRLTEMVAPTRYWRLLIGTGFCGALTTFSTFQGRDDHAGEAWAPRSGARLCGREPRCRNGVGGCCDRGRPKAPLRMITVLAWIGVGVFGAPNPRSAPYRRIEVSVTTTQSLTRLQAHLRVSCITTASQARLAVATARPAVPFGGRARAFRGGARRGLRCHLPLEHATVGSLVDQPSRRPSRSTMAIIGAASSPPLPPVTRCGSSQVWGGCAGIRSGL
jgi:hypothetical protein